MRSLCASFVALLVATISGCSSYELRENWSYDQSNVPFGVFDVYTPLGADGKPLKGPLPAIVAVHGGAWQGGNKGDMSSFADLVCPHGYVVLAPNYRLSVDGPGWTGAKWAAQIDDCQTALRYFRANPGVLGIDPNRIGAFGVSAGGHLTTMLALRDDPKSNDNLKGRVVCTFEADGEHDMTLPPDKIMADAVNILTHVFGHAPPWSDAELKDISTVTFARQDAAVFVFHEIYDTNVYVVNADNLYAALKAKGADVSILKLPGSNHSGGWQDAKTQIIGFFDKHLK